MTIDDHPANSEIIQQIHADFRNSQDVIISSLNIDLNELLQTEELEKQITKGEKMRDLGFIQAKGSEVLRSELDKRKKQVEEKRKLLNTIMEYTVKYPTYKFISETEVEKLCIKYRLVCGYIFRYKGEIPQTNLEDILKFKELINKKDIPEGKNVMRNLSFLSKDEIIRMHIDLEGNDYKKGAYSYHSIYDEGPVPMKICAPAQNMDLKEARVSNNYKMEALYPVSYPDPIVLQPVHEGYLIVTAWGNEASDLLVVNPIRN